ncbi:hypothetical protein BCR33DRAFT_784112 [Rhizoclosmatium globosum]|uniref:Uncharacterized protein n=1 Tax=Rhizoclosmatium globosum TaxID=329046 RepID=A0A1Y2CG61_9FUNG|nr:hypothetical protein BCR33DRAFT_784112 [Rhizoclosmatium globosum]|eukprot:ORY45992.1 hypothetical protein BCR33DRAFT_784112 [Rhizoclosmatium globosum]
MIVATNYTGGVFEKLYLNAFDCPGIPQPNATALACLAFSVKDFSTAENPILFETITSNIVWKDTTHCSGDFADRIQAVYGKPISDFEPPDVNVRFNLVTSFVESIWFDLTLSSDKTPIPVRRADEAFFCSLTYASTAVRYSGPLSILAENNPVCGANAPKLVWDPKVAQYTFGVVQYIDSQGSATFNIINPNGTSIATSSDLAAAYNVQTSAIIYKLINNVQFSLTVTANKDSPSADNSCVYEYHLFQVPETQGRSYSFYSVEAGEIPLLQNATISDGCIDTLYDIGAVTSAPGEFAFTNSTTSACGSGELQKRFARLYDEKKYSFTVRLLTAAVISVYVSDHPEMGNLNRGERRDGLQNTRYLFVDRNTLPKATSTIATTVSTVVPTSVSTTTVVATRASSAPLASNTVVTTSAAILTTTSSVVVVPTGYQTPNNNNYEGPSNYGGPAPATSLNPGLYRGNAAGKVGVIFSLLAGFLLS